MAKLLAIPAEPDRRRPARDQPEGLRRRAAAGERPRRRLPRRLLRAHRAREGAARPRRGLPTVPPPRADDRAAQGSSARGRRLSWPRAGAVPRGREARSSRRPASADEFTYHGAVDRDGKLAFLQIARRAVGAGDLRRAEGRVPARGDGERRAGRAAAARRVHRDRREDRRRPARRRPTTRRRWPTGCTSCGRIARKPTRSARAASTASARTTASSARPIG